MNIQELSMHQEILYRYFKGKGWHRIALLMEEVQERKLSEIINTEKDLIAFPYEGESNQADVLVYMQKTALEKWGGVPKLSCPSLCLSELLRRFGICMDCLAYPENGLEQALLEKQRRLEKRGIRCFNFLFPFLKEIKNLSDKEQLLLEKSADSINKKTILEQPEFYRSFFDKYKSEEIEELFPEIMGIVQRGERKYLSDYKGPLVNIIQGYRYTTDAPEKYRHSVYLFGKSQVYGYGCEDADTIASCLQRLLNREYPNSYRVFNYAVSAVSDYECLLHLKEEQMQKGDCVIYLHMKRRCFHPCCQPPLLYENLTGAFEQKNREMDLFLDSIPHFNFRANQMLSEKIYRTIRERLGERVEENKQIPVSQTEKRFSVCRPEEIYLHDYDDEEELKEYLQKIRIFKKQGGKNGAIVMNCNPFTLGHRYLIETAAGKVAQLYILVVEEDKSRFPFKDRLQLVREGTEDIGNVMVLSGGSFVISSLTFPEYFQKEKEKDIKIDPSLDIEVFASYIAPALEIQIRFAGEEPLDPVTRQYNDTMARLLPKFGIEFMEIKRKKSGEQVISASRVRKLMDENRYEEIKELVPETTYSYLLERRNNEGESI